MFWKNLMLFGLIIINNCYCSFKENCKHFLIEDKYNLKNDFENVRDYNPINTSTMEKMNFWQGRIYRQQKILTMLNSLLNKTLATNATCFERGILSLSLLSAYKGAGGNIKEYQKLYDSVVKMMKNNEDSDISLEQQIAFLENLIILCSVVNKDSVKDIYGITNNQNIYQQLLISETQKLQKMLDSKKETYSMNEKQYAFKILKYSIRTMIKLGIICKK